MKEFFKRGLKIIVVFSVAAVGTVFFFVLSAMAASINEAHPSGVLIDLGDANHTILLIQDGKGIGIPSPSVFYSHGFSFNKVVSANKYDPFFASSVMKYADGTIVNENSTIYIVGSGKKRGFTRPEIFKELGYSFEKSNIVIPEDFYKQTFAQYQAGTPISSSLVHPEGALIQAGGTIYQIKNGRRMAIPSTDVFISNGLKWSNVVPYIITDLNEYKFDPYNSGDIMKFRDGTLVLDTADNRTVYVISDGKKRGITSPESLEAYGYKWDNIVSGYLSSYKSGDVISAYNESATDIIGSVRLSSGSPISGNIEHANSYKGVGVLGYEAMKLTFAATASYTIQSLSVHINGAKNSSDYEVKLWNGDINIADDEQLKNNIATFEEFKVEVTPSSPVTLIVKLMAYSTAGIGEKIYLSVNSSSDIEVVNGKLSGNFPVKGAEMTVISSTSNFIDNTQTYSSANFILVSDLNSSASSELLRFFEAFKKYFESNYFSTSSQAKIEVTIFENQDDYIKYFGDDSYWGLCDEEEGSLVSYRSAGIGTYANFISAILFNDPFRFSWFSNGFSKFFEKFMGYYDNTNGLKLMEGLPNLWRREEFVESINSGAAIKPTLLSVIAGSYKTPTGTTERLLTEFLHEHNWWKNYVKERIKLGEDFTETDGSLIMQVSGKVWNQLESDWSVWLDNIINTTESGQINSIPASFVLEDKQAWDAWWATNSKTFSWINNLRIE